MFLVSYLEDQREMDGEALIRAGFDVWTFTDPLKALAAALAARPDIIVTGMCFTLTRVNDELPLFQGRTCCWRR
jgi:hypothetical protein